MLKSIRRFSSQVVRYHEHGSPLQVLHLEDDDRASSLGPLEVQVNFIAAPINVADLNMVQGNYGLQPPLPAVGGNEGVAIVTEIGSQVTTLQKKDHVILNQAGIGTWRTSAVAPAEAFMKIPADFPLDQAATISTIPCTAYRLLSQDFETLTAGDVVIQNGANSAVGKCVIQLAKARGIRTINVVGSDVADYDVVNDHLKGIGGDIVCVDSYVDTPDFHRLLADLPAPKLGLNCIGGKVATNVARAVAKGGTFVTYGGMSRHPVTIPTSLLIFNQLHVRGFWMTEWLDRHSQEEREEMLREVMALSQTNALMLWTQEFPLSEFRQALEVAGTGSSSGDHRKVVLRMDK